MARPTRKVPCGSCLLCCKGEAIILHPEDGDDPSNYETITVPHPLGTGKMVQQIKTTITGACMYLGKTGCTIYSKRPVICREFDCRLLAKRFGDLALSTANPVMLRGRELNMIEEGGR